MITTKSLEIRKFTISDIDDEYISWFKNKDNFKFSRHKNINFNKNLLENFFKEFNKTKNLFLLCIDKKTKKKIATLNIYFENNYLANVGILLGNQNFKRMGYASRILKLVFLYLFNNYFIEKIVMGMSESNIPMIKTCKKIKMLKINEFSIKKKIFINFSVNKKKNNKVIGVVCKDSGSANQILFYLKKNQDKNRYIFFLKNPALSIFKKFNFTKKNYVSNYKEIIKNADQVIFGTGSTDFEKKILSICIKKKIESIAVIDHLTNSVERLRYKKNMIIPNKIYVFDDYVHKSLKNSYKNIVKIKNYYLEHIKENVKNHLYKKKIVFFCEPFLKDKKTKKYPEHESINFFAKNINYFRFYDNHEIIFKLHPKQNFYKYKILISKICGKYNIKFKIIKNVNLIDVLSSSNYFFGITSYAMIIASYLNKKTYHCILPSQNIKLLPQKNIKSFYNIIKNKY
jgi:RimJ/RimL family protein N-acetyltransferase